MKVPTYSTNDESENVLGASWQGVPASLYCVQNDRDVLIAPGIGIYQDASSVPRIEIRQLLRPSGGIAAVCRHPERDRIRRRNYLAQFSPEEVHLPAVKWHQRILGAVH